MCENSGVENVLKETTSDQRDWESMRNNGIPRRETIDCMVVKNISLTQEEENDTASKKDKTLIWIKRIALVMICTVVAGGFSIPIVIYYLELSRSRCRQSCICNKS